MESKRIDRGSWKAMDPQSKLQDDKVDKVHIYLIIPLEPQHSVKAPNVSRISLTAGHRAAAIIRNRIPLILRFYLRRKIGGPADRATDRPPTSSLPLSLPSVPTRPPLAALQCPLGIGHHHHGGGDTVATNYELTLRLATVPSERGNDVPSFVSGETKVIKPRGLLDNLAYVPRYVPRLTKVRCWRALRRQPRPRESL